MAWRVLPGGCSSGSSSDQFDVGDMEDATRYDSAGSDDSAAADDPTDGQRDALSDALAADTWAEDAVDEADSGDMSGGDSSCTTIPARLIPCTSGSTPGWDPPCDPSGWPEECDRSRLDRRDCYWTYRWRCSTGSDCPPDGGWPTADPDTGISAPPVFPDEMAVPVYVEFATEAPGHVVVIESAMECDDAWRISIHGCAIGPRSLMYGYLVEELLVLPASPLPVEVRLALPPNECSAPCVEALERLGLTCVGAADVHTTRGCLPSGCTSP